MLLQDTSPYGTGHGNDVIFLFDYMMFWPLLYNGTTPDPWHYEATDIFGDNWSTFCKSGAPMKYWTQLLSANLETLVMTNNSTNAVKTMQNGLTPQMDFWLNIFPAL